MNRTLFILMPAILMLVVGCSQAVVDDGARDLERGRAAWAAQDLKQAEEAFAACARKSSTNFEARLSLALVGLQLGEPRVADNAAREAVAIDPSSAEAHLAEGQTAYLVKDYARAKAAFTVVADAQELEKPMRSQALASRAVVELAAFETDAARLSLLRARRLDFRNAAAWYHLGVLSRGTYHFLAAAKEQFEMACRLEPESQRTRETLRTVIPALRDALARLAADKPGAAKRDPGLAAKLLAEGAAAQKKKDLKTALARFEKAKSVDPLSWEAAWHYAQTLPVVEAAKKQGDKTKLPAATVIARTLDAYRAALDAKPASRETCQAAARFALQNKRPAEACKFMSHALAHFPESKPVLELYVDALGRLGTPEGQKSARLYKAYMQEL
ncbi:MAG: hypothetical protein IKO72_16480 [Kiritimatiellae bacterium]|nr:hypothetical protein [Kiritimatiellia bacterium]